MSLFEQSLSFRLTFIFEFIESLKSPSISQVWGISLSWYRWQDSILVNSFVKRTNMYVSWPEENMDKFLRFWYLSQCRATRAQTWLHKCTDLPQPLYPSTYKILICFFGLMLYIPVNSYGHVRTVSSPNHTFFLASLTMGLSSTSCTYFRL